MTWRINSYWPLITIVLLSILMSLAIKLSLDHLLFMNLVMGFFLCLLSMLKLFDIKGFANGFSMYDILAKKSRYYALSYPFIELSLGLLYLSGLKPMMVNVITLMIMLIGALGVIKALKAGLNVRCACLGSMLIIPLSSVTIIENGSMAVMAMINIYNLSN